MTEKTLGQLGFEAYNAARGGLTHDGKPIPPWDSLIGPTGESVRAAWEISAKTIEEHVNANRVVEVIASRIMGALMGMRAPVIAENAPALLAGFREMPPLALRPLMWFRLLGRLPNEDEVLEISARVREHVERIGEWYEIAEAVANLRREGA